MKLMQMLYKERFLARFNEIPDLPVDTLDLLAEAASEVAYDLLEEDQTSIRMTRESLAVELKKRGYTLRKIGAVMGIDHPQKVQHLLNQAIKHQGEQS